MTGRMTLAFLALYLSIAIMLAAAENLRLNPQLDFSSDSRDGPLITGDRLETVSSVASRTTFSCSVKADSTPSGRLAAPSVSTRSIKEEYIL